MAEPVVVFLSAVSSEFHQSDPRRPLEFRSYRDALADAFRRAGVTFQIIVREELAQGPGDLLETLDTEIGRCNLVVHLIGDAAGVGPEPAAIRRLKERHPDFLDHEPELQVELGDLTGLSYTQLEIYLAFHYRCDRLVFLADAEAPQSPGFRFDPEQRASQDRHVGRLVNIAEHRESFFSQDDLALKCVTSAVRIAEKRSTPPDPKDIAAAEKNPHALVIGIAAESRKIGMPSEPPVFSQAAHNNLDVYLEALQRVAEKHHLDRKTLLAVIEDYARSQSDTAEDADSLDERALTYFALGDSPIALDLARRSVEVRERTLGPEHQDTLKSLGILEGLLETKGEFGEAEPLSRRIFETYERTLGPKHQDTLESLNNFAVLLQKHGKLEKAEPLYKRALKARKHILGPEDPETLASLHNLAALLQARGEGEWVQAEQMYWRVCEARESNLGPEDPETLRSLNNLAGLLQSNGELAQAERLYRRAYEARERTLGPEHRDTLNSRHNVAFLLRAKGVLDEAERLYRLNLEDSERVLGPEHAATLFTLHNLAALLRDKQEYTEAEKLFEKVLEVRKHTLGPKHPQTITSLVSFAILLQEKGEHREAESLFQQAVEAAKGVLDPDHPVVKTAKKGLKDCRNNASKSNRA